MSVIEKIYQRLPISLQNFVCSTYGYIEGKKRYSSLFYHYLQQFEVTQWLSNDAIDGYKKSMLSAALCRAKKTQYYGCHLVELTNGDIYDDPYSALQLIPISTKEHIIANYEEIVLRTTDKSFAVKTSGTTGKALKLLKTKCDFAVQWAIWIRHRNRFGIELGDVSVNFTGKSVVPIAQKSAPFWRYNAAQNQYLVNMQHINEKNIPVIVGFLNSVSPKFYSGYPSIIAEVSRLALSAGLVLEQSSRPMVIFCGAENVLSHQKDVIEQWSSSLVTDQYGLTEGNCNLSRCELGRYHEDFEFSHFEIIAPEYLSDGRIRGRLVSTSFYNMAFPLVRYDTGDVATIMPESYRCQCGRKSRVIDSIEGRIDDYVATNDGKRIMRFDYLFKDTFDIKEVQVIQRALGSIVILAVLRSGADQVSFEKVIRQRVVELINSEMKVTFEYTDVIPKSNTGKFKAVLNLT